MRIGCIGTGSMGSMLARGYCESADPNLQVLVCNRTRSKLTALIEKYPSMQAIDSAEELAARSDVIFLCVKPSDAWDVIHTIRDFITPDQHFISINSALSLEDLESTLPCYVTKIIPSITQEARSGTILTMYGKRLDSIQKTSVEGILGKIGSPQEIPEDKVRIYSDLTSCGPAFFSFILREWVEAAVQVGDIPLVQAETMVLETLHGLAALLRDNDFTIEDVLRRVTVPGGVTAVGLRAMEPSLRGVFEGVFQATRSHNHQPK